MTNCTINKGSAIAMQITNNMVSAIMIINLYKVKRKSWQKVTLSELNTPTNWTQTYFDAIRIS